MRRISNKLRHFHKLLNIKKRKKGRRLSKRRKKRKLKRKIIKQKYRSYFEILKLRKEVTKAVYRKRNYKSPPITIKVKGQFGLEEDNQISHFLNIAESLVEFNSKSLKMDFQDCTRVWPSAITLLCSIKQWTELTSSKKNAPKIYSTSSKSDKVNSYLSHSGFYDYVQRLKEETFNYYSDNEIVKIEREISVTNIEKRENEIVNLLERFSVLNYEGIEEFNDVVLTEIFNNVLEHGISHKDKGWWLLAQYHPTHRIISLNIADNGIGIRNTLMTGPQRNDLQKKSDNIPEEDGNFIYLACQPNISGALAASVKEGFIIKKYVSGSRRGNGLQRVLSTCRKLKIPLAILSHNGYIFFDENGNIKLNDSKRNKIFAGTMYHLRIKTK